MESSGSMKRHLLSLAAILLTVAVGIDNAQGPAQYPQQGPGPYPQPPYLQQGPESGLPQGPDQGSPEAQQGVGRVSLIQGNVSTQRGDTGEWVALTPNTPLVAGDSISTGPGSRAEVQLDYANVLRLSEGASVKIANLTPAQIQVQVGQGLVNHSVLRPSEAAVEIETPNAAVHPLGPGSYRIFVDPNGETQVIVRNGAADVSTAQGSTQAERGQLIRIQGGNNPQYQTVYAPALDDWDRWNGDRDRLVNGAQSWQHTNPYYVGTQDLDSYGQWTNDSDYGNVWVPEQGPDWAPYRDGRWVSEPYYGWTWVSYEPWGWAPYHYGRWFLHSGAWAWWPGPIGFGYRPLWAPAYVSFLGFGGGGLSIGIGFGFGSVGWCPIGPGDYFYPWYGRWGGRRDSVRFDGRGFDERGLRGIGPLAGRGFSNIHEAFRNDRVRAGITSMAANQFGRGGVPIHQQAINAGALQQGRMMAGGLPMSPSRESFRPTGQLAHPSSVPSRAVGSQRFFSNPRAGSAFRPFGGQAVQRNPGLNPRTSGAADSRSNAPTTMRTAPQPGWRGFGSGSQGAPVQGSGPARAQNPVYGSRPGASASPSPGWQGFRGAQPGYNRVPPSDRQPSNTPYRQVQPESSGGNFGGPSRMPQSLPSRPAPSYGGGRPGGGSYGYSRPPLNMPYRQVQPESSGGNFGGPSRMPQSLPSRPAPSYGGGRSDSYSRPPLNMGQPVVTQRGSSSGYSGSSGGGYRGGPYGGQSAPSHAGGGGHSGGGRSSGRGR